MRRPSSRDLSALPDPAVFERLCQSLALLDAVVCRDWEGRYYSYNRAWDESAGQRLGSMRNGEGDEWYAVFQPEGTFVRGFAVEAPLRNPAGVFDGVPPALAPLVGEPAFGDDTTFCFWNTGAGWSRGSHALPPTGDPDGSAGLLAILRQRPDGPDPVLWKHFAASYHERDVPLEAIRKIYAHEPLTAELLAALAPGVTLAELAEDLAEIGWPVA